MRRQEKSVELYVHELSRRGYCRGVARKSHFKYVARDISAVREATRGHILKVIIECCLLTDEEKIRMCSIVAEGGADFIKTSTGFSKGGATRSDVALLRKYSPENVQVKAAGGISSIEDAEDFISLGATRLGTSRIVKLAEAQET